jgi:hypothetical protein
MRIPVRAAVVASLGVGVLGAALGACATEDDGGIAYAYGGGGYGGDCSAYTTCGTCTPVAGCGWCYTSDGSGVCAPGPSACPGQSFTWTWEPMGCFVPAEASVGSAASPDASTPEAASSEAAPPETGSSEAANPEGAAPEAAPEAAIPEDSSVDGPGPG